MTRKDSTNPDPQAIRDLVEAVRQIVVMTHPSVADILATLNYRYEAARLRDLRDVYDRVQDKLGGGLTPLRGNSCTNY